jgi:predicted nucleic acid-binding protein
LIFLLDTNIVSELRKAKAGKANRGVVEWASQVPSAVMYLSAMSLLEIEYGVLLAERSGADKGAILRAWFEEDVKVSFSDRAIPIDGEVAIAAASFLFPQRVPLADALIAATAQTHGLTVVTGDLRDFSRFPDVEVLNPWT